MYSIRLKKLSNLAWAQDPAKDSATSSWLGIVDMKWWMVDGYAIQKLGPAQYFKILLNYC